MPLKINYGPIVALGRAKAQIRARLAKMDGQKLEAHTVLPAKYACGPHGLGDPADRSLRRVEKEVMIPMKLRDRAKAEKCIPQVQDFTKCCKDAGIAMVLKCRKENAALKECLTQWYRDPEFIAECTNQYLEERSEYRRTGIPLREQKRKETTSF
ncbi:unnamed protein product [Darwinula stevensoni]|uniref:COX assembly mitochondrial protein n=1 Tax=Darwinula stevensoni TaxID=69355 RepID=A0A7R9A3R2_9CRUS|nr:unnamed protein product [Darwinula stevensoni]CAG0888491.1 unnamed protein product [Darwinula stevensoni]